MAGDWIKMRVSIAYDPAVIGMAEKLGHTEFSVVGMLHHIWSWADTQSRDGHADGVTEKWIDRYVQCDGFSKAMQSVGWLIVSESGVEFPRFDRHNGETAKTRALANNRQKKKRANVTENDTVLSRNHRDQSVTREEKRREEDKELLSPDSDDGQSRVTYSSIQQAYNEICSPTLPACAVMNDKRKRQIKAMGQINFMGAKPFTKGIEVWRQYFTDCLSNPHWCGQNDRGWTADFDFVTNPKNAIKLMERMN
jgi:hypothetical protein